MSNIDDVKNLYEGIAAEAFKMPERVDPADIRKAQRAKKVRNLATDGATEGERAAAERKTKGPKMFGEGKYSNSETYVKGTAPVRATYGGKTESFPKETYKKKSKKNVTEDTCPVCGFDPCQCLEGTLTEKKKDCVKADKKTMHNCAKKVCSEQWGVGECIYGQHAVPDADGNVAWYDVLFEHGIEKGVDISTLEVLEEGSHNEHVEHEGAELTEKKDETNIGGGNLKKLAKKATKRVDSNVDGTVNSSDMKDSDVGEFVPGPTGGKVKTKARFENWRSDMPPLVERTMTAKDKKKEDRLKDKYDDSEMKQNMIDRYGKEEGEKIYYATIRKQAMKEEIDKRRAPAELVSRLSAKREGHMAQDGPNKAAYDAKQRLLAKSKAKRVDEAKFFPNAEDPFGSTDKLKKVKRPGTIKNKGAGYKEGQALKQTIMKKEGRMGKVESQKDKLRKRGKLNIPSPKDMTDRKKQSLERILKAPDGTKIYTNMPKGGKTTPEQEVHKAETKAKLEKSLKSKMGGSDKMKKAASDIKTRAAKDSSVGPESKAAASRVLSGNISGKGEEQMVGSAKKPSKAQRAKLNLSRDLAKDGVSTRSEPGGARKKQKLDDTTKGGPVKVIKKGKKLPEEYLALYEDVIAALLDAEYALNEESASNLFDCMTYDALTAITEQYLEEKARGTRKKSTAHIYDMDETLYGHDHSKVRVHVNDKSGKRIQSLSNQEFNTHKLDKAKGHKYDFSEFGSSKTFQKSAKPLKKMIKHMKRQKARGYDTHIVTARSDFDDKHHLAKQLKKHGVDITPNKKGTHTHLHRSGNEEGDDVGKKKQRVLARLGKRHGYKKIHMYDDAEKVHKATHNKTPGVKVKGHMVKPNKKGEVTSRPYKPTKPGTGRNNNK